MSCCVSALIQLPVELLTHISKYLNFEDLSRLKRSERSISQKLRIENLYRSFMQRSAPFSKEATIAADGFVNHSSAYGRIVSRREAYALAQPCSLVVLGHANSFVFQDGILGYVERDNIHILDLHNDVGTQFKYAVSAVQEAAVNCYGTFEEEISLAYILNFPGGKILIQLNAYEAQARAVVRGSHEYVQMLEPSWSFDLSQMPAWFRLSQNFVVCGNHNGIGENTHHEWVIQVFSRMGASGMAHPPYSVQLARFFGVDIGQTVAFEIFDGYLYAVSNTSSPEVEEIDWTSYYHCYRFPVNNQRQETLQYAQFWRRQHREGPINDSWTSLSLQKDEGTGSITICEARREWKNASSTQERTFYIQPIKFNDLNGPTTINEDSEDGEHDQALMNTSHASNTSNPLDLSNSLDTLNPSNFSDPSNPSNPPNTAYPANDVLVSAIDDTNKPLYEPPKPRPPRSLHPEFPSPGVSSAKQKTYILTNTKHRSYNLASSAFLDIVTEDSKRAFNTAQIFLRIGSRCLDGPLDTETGLLRKPVIHEDTGELIPHSEERFRDRGINLWPPPSAPEELLEILQTKGSGRKMEAITDERSVILAIGTGPEKKLVLVNFDPEIQFPGLEAMTLPKSAVGGDTSFSEVILQSQGKSHRSSRSTEGDKGKKRAHPELADDGDDVVQGKKAKGGGSEVDDKGDEVMLDAAVTASVEPHENWLTPEPADWLSIGKGFRFVYN